MRKIVVLLLLTPFLIWFVLNIKFVFTEISQTGKYISSNIVGFFSQEKIMYVDEMGWNAFSEDRNDILSRFFYNEGCLIADNFFSYLSYFSPRMFFQAGDSGAWTPQGIEPIAAITFPFFVIGILVEIKNKNKSIFWTLIFGLFAFVAGRRNLVFLFPVVLMYLYFVTKGFDLVKWNKKLIYALCVYGVFILGRAIWLRY